MIPNLDTTGLMLLCSGLLIRYLIGWQKFRRRNMAGMQIFRSYFLALLMQLVEWLGNIVASALIILGIITILMRL